MCCMPRVRELGKIPSTLDPRLRNEALEDCLFLALRSGRALRNVLLQCPVFTVREPRPRRRITGSGSHNEFLVESGWCTAFIGHGSVHKCAQTCHTPPVVCSTSLFHIDFSFLWSLCPQASLKSEGRGGRGGESQGGNH